MIEHYLKLASSLKSYPNFPKKYLYVIDEINFLNDREDKDGPAYCNMKGEITILMHFELDKLDTYPAESCRIFKLTFLRTCIHEIAHHVQIKECSGNRNLLEEHGGEFKNACISFGLDPEAEGVGALGEPNHTYPFYDWAERTINGI